MRHSILVLAVLAIFLTGCPSNTVQKMNPPTKTPATQAQPPNDWTQLTLLGEDGLPISPLLADSIGIVGQPRLKAIVGMKNGKFSLRLEENKEYKIFVYQGEKLIGSDTIYKDGEEKMIDIYMKGLTPKHKTGTKKVKTDSKDKVVID